MIYYLNTILNLLKVKKYLRVFKKNEKKKMYIDLKHIIKKFNLEIDGIIHVGGCKGEELFSYMKNNIRNVILIEANPELISILKIKKFIFHYIFRMNLSVESFAAYYEDFVSETK
mgnify:CR=1 FL=1